MDGDERRTTYSKRQPVHPENSSKQSTLHQTEVVGVFRCQLEADEHRFDVGCPRNVIFSETAYDHVQRGLHGRISYDSVIQTLLFKRGGSVEHNAELWILVDSVVCEEVFY